jgi:hypothetical protein
LVHAVKITGLVVSLQGHWLDHNLRRFVDQVFYAVSPRLFHHEGASAAKPQPKGRKDVSVKDARKRLGNISRQGAKTQS